MKEVKIYRWPDLSPVVRQYLVKDDQGRVGVAYIDPVYHDDGVLFARPADTPATIDAGNAILMTDTAWHKQGDEYSGSWYDADDRLRITIVQDLGWLMPDRWANVALAGSDQRGHWDYGATLGKIGGEPPVKGQTPQEMTADQAESYAREVGESVTARAIRYAAAHGFIQGARKIGRDWLIPYEGMNNYLDNRPKRGRK